LQPSIQKLVGNLGSDCLTHLTEEAVHTDAYTQDTPGIKKALLALEAEFSSSVVDPDLLANALQKAPTRIAKRKYRYDQTVPKIDCLAGFVPLTFPCQISAILAVALKPTTHVSHSVGENHYMLHDQNVAVAICRNGNEILACLTQAGCSNFP
jgi:hypothetical protein